MHISRKTYVSLGVILWSLAIVLAILPSWPHLYYRLFPQTSSSLASTIASTVSAADATNQQPSTLPETAEPALPEVDPSLPTENGLIIDKIGVRGAIHEGTDWENILRLGIWRSPDFGTPEDTVLPTIIAAHRFGYLNWSAAFRKLNSFYSLPQLSSGDIIKIIWNQRPFEYKVYSTETGPKITDYGADLILYTCQLWNSPLRFFVYAERTN